MNVHIRSTGITPFGRRSESLVDLLADAGLRAMEGAGRKPIDRLVIGSMLAGSIGATENLAAQLADRLGLDSSAGERVEAASASGAAAFHVAVAGLSAGRSDRTLVVAGEKMTARPTPEVAAALARSLAPSEERAGASMPALAALVAQRYLDRFHLAPEAFDAVSVQFRASAVRNPNAHFRTAVTAEGVATSRPVALPLRLLHCSAMSDGAAAVVIERGDGGAEVLGLGQAFDSLMLADRVDLTSFRATRSAAQRAYEMAHLTRKEVEVVELHDAFAPFALIDLEDLGFCGAGEAAAWFAGGWTAEGGRLPVNPSGGLLGRGHPVGASGLVQIALIAQQLLGLAGPLAIGRVPRVGLAQSIGGLGTHNFVTLLGRGSAA
jgi:acetyl-CoA C-acetyltransferase